MEEKENLINKVLKREYFNFEDFLSHLKEYKETHHNLNMKTKYICPDVYKLGQKISHIRNGSIKLNDQQKARLNEIGFIWDAKSFDFELFYQHLVEYKKGHHNLNIKIRYICPDGYKLGQKINSIRSNLLKLTENQKARLNEIGFIWDAKSFDFEDFLSHLQEYKKEFGDVDIKQKYVCKDGYKLGQKIQSIRVGNIKLTEEQKTKLNEIGFIWDAKSFDFELFYQHLVEYKKEFKNVDVKQMFVCQDGYRLGKKIHGIRSNRIKLTEEQKEKLNEIGFVWNAAIAVKLKKFDFELFFNNLIAYKQQFGDCFVEFDFILDNYELGFYVKNIRNRRIKLTDNQIKQLNNLGFVFNTQEYYKNKPDEPLIRRMLNGDISARNDFIQKYMPLVYKIAAKYKEIANYSDLVGIGYDALDKVIDNINPANDTPQIYKYVGKSILGKIVSNIKKIKNVKSLQDDVHDCEDLTIEDTIPDNEYRPDSEVEDRAFNEQLLSKAKQILTKDEYKLICLRFGFNKSATEYTINQLAERYNTTPQKVERALQKILIKLKQNLKKDEWLI